MTSYKKINLPDWLEKRYSILWEQFKDKTFSRDEVIKVLKEKSNDNKTNISVFLSELKK